MASTIVIWFVLHFSWDWKYLSDEDIGLSIITSLGQFIQPLFTPLGFGSQLSGAFGWVFIVAAITGLIAKENVIGTFGVLAAVIVASGSVAGVAGLSDMGVMIQGTGIGVPGLLAFIAFNMLTIPCFAAVATAKAELPKGKFAGTLLFWIAISYVVSSAIYLIGTWWWTSFIFLVLIAGLIVGVVLYNKKHPTIGGRAV